MLAKTGSGMSVRSLRSKPLLAKKWFMLSK